MGQVDADDHDAASAADEFGEFDDALGIQGGLHGFEIAQVEV